MKRINVFLMCLTAVMAISFFASCNSGTENVFTKKITAIEQAKAKIPAANATIELNEINAALEKELAAIDEACAEELAAIADERIKNAEAYKNDEDSLKKVQSSYDDAYIERVLSLLK